MLVELNPEQLSAVRHDDGPLLIVAGAGTGKTATLVHRVAHLIERDYLNQGLVLRPRRGSRPEIWLNRDSEVVRRLVQAS